MSEILLRADEARSAASDLRSKADNAESEFNATRQRLSSLAPSFKGRTAEAFESRFSEWRASATQLTQNLGNLAKFLEGAANTIEQTDQQIASQLG
jgi:WXG100 family type VII secretion target